MKNSQYLLYIRSGCPFCQKVLRFMNEEGIALPTLDIAQLPAGKTDLINYGGKEQVPCLIINGNALYESDDIIEYLKDHEAELKAS